MMAVPPQAPDGADAAWGIAHRSTVYGRNCGDLDVFVPPLRATGFGTRSVGDW
jgi:hypothetical protein